MTEQELELKLKTFPESPGVYNYFDKDGKILYVGKAKNLKKRVSSYFTKTHENGKTRVLVSKIMDIKYVVTPTETDALLLENTLIKKLKPRYNILLKDDKTYPWICITKEDFPRVFLTRNKKNSLAEYFGPYSNVKSAKNLLSLIKELTFFRTCRLPLSEKTIEGEKYKVCLEYHIKNCKAPCVNFQTRQQYLQNIETARNIIKGKYSEVISELYNKMKELSNNLKFEEANLVKKKYDSLKDFQAKSTINSNIEKADFFSIVSDTQGAFVNYLQIRNGSIIKSYNLELQKRLDESDEEILALAIVEIFHLFQSDTKEIYVPLELDLNLGDSIKISIPKLGDKKMLLEISERQAKEARIESLKKERIVDPEKHTKRLMEQMKKDLSLDVEPRHIECFDNSNLQGTNPVSACVVFRDGKPSKRDYRIFNVKTVEGANDFATMEEVLLRRYTRLKEEGEQNLPQLIIIDGGKGQLSAAYKIVKQLDLDKKIKIIGIAKRLEELYFVDKSEPLWLSKRSETLRVIQQLRDEAHRFGITRHRSKRSKAALDSFLTSIDGIGENTAKKLLQKFGSVKKIEQAGKDAIIPIVGQVKAESIFKAFEKM